MGILIHQASTHQRGQEWEKRAAAYLRRRAWTILERNYRTPVGEIDLIARRADVLSFIEVKGRRNVRKGNPLEAVSPHKVKRVCAAAAMYLAQAREKFRIIRFDVVTVGPEKTWWGTLKVKHIEDAFRPEGFFNV
jgi:putative endonuclease